MESAEAITVMPVPLTSEELKELSEAGWCGDTIGDIPGPVRGWFRALSSAVRR